MVKRPTSGYYSHDDNTWGNGGVTKKEKQLQFRHDQRPEDQRRVLLAPFLSLVVSRATKVEEEGVSNDAGEECKKGRGEEEEKEERGPEDEEEVHGVVLVSWRWF